MEFVTNRVCKVPEISYNNLRRRVKNKYLTPKAGCCKWTGEMADIPTNVLILYQACVHFRSALIIAECTQRFSSCKLTDLVKEVSG